MSADVTTTNGQFRASLSKELFVQRQINTLGRGSGFTMDARGERFLLVVDPNQAGQQEAALRPLTVVVSWAAMVIEKK